MLVTVAPPGGKLEPPSPVSPLGSNTDPDLVAVGLDHTGRPAAAWHEREDSTFAPDRLVTAFGRIGGARKPIRRDRRPPHASAQATMAGARAASHGRPLRVRAACDEPCAARVALQGGPTVKWPTEFGYTRAVLKRRVPATVRVRVLPKLEHRLRRRLKNGVVRIRIIATDRAGNAAGQSFGLQ